MCAWHANEYFIESGRNSDQQKNYFDPNDLSLRTSYREQDYPYRKRAGGRPSNQPNKQLVAKGGRGVFPKNSRRTTSNTRHFLQHSRGNHK